MSKNLFLFFLYFSLYFCEDQKPTDYETGLKRFLALVREEPGSKRPLWLGMGLNSDNPLIFYHCLDQIVSLRHFDSRKTISRLLEADVLEKKAKNAAWIAWMKLEYYQLQEKEKVPWLQKVFFDVDPKKFRDFILWCVQEYGEYAIAKDGDALIPLDTYPWLSHEIELTRHKMVINTWCKTPLDRYIEASQHDNFSVREWGLKHLETFEDKKVAEYLQLLHEQNSISTGLLGFEQVKKALEKHKFLFPQFYSEAENTNKNPKNPE